MKKTSLFFVLISFCLMLNAKSFIKLHSGSTDCLRENAKAVVEMDWSKATWEKYKPIKEYCKDEYEKRFELSEIAFVRGFNKNSKGLLCVSGESAKYKIVIHMEDFFQKVGGGWGRLYIRLYGLIEVVDLNSGETVAIFYVDGLSGDADYVQNDRFAKSFEQLGKILAKMK